MWFAHKSLKKPVISGQVYYLQNIIVLCLQHIMGQIISLSAHITTTILCFMAYLNIIPSNTSLMFVIKMLLLAI